MAGSKRNTHNEAPKLYVTFTTLPLSRAVADDLPIVHASFDPTGLDEGRIKQLFIEVQKRLWLTPTTNDSYLVDFDPPSHGEHDEVALESIRARLPKHAKHPYISRTEIEARKEYIEEWQVRVSSNV
jgi:hypothetical protein